MGWLLLSQPSPMTPLFPLFYRQTNNQTSEFIRVQMNDPSGISHIWYFHLVSLALPFGISGTSCTSFGTSGASGTSTWCILVLPFGTFNTSGHLVGQSIASMSGFLVCGSVFGFCSGEESSIFSLSAQQLVIYPAANHLPSSYVYVNLCHSATYSMNHVSWILKL